MTTITLRLNSNAIKEAYEIDMAILTKICASRIVRREHERLEVSPTMQIDNTWLERRVLSLFRSAVGSLTNLSPVKENPIEGLPDCFLNLRIPMDKADMAPMMEEALFNYVLFTILSERLAVEGTADERLSARSREYAAMARREMETLQTVIMLIMQL